MEKEIYIPNKEELIKVMRQNHIVFAAIFGSRAKGTARPDSDYDFLVEFDPKSEIGLFEFIRAKDKIRSIVGKDIDLVTVNGVSPYIKDNVINSMKVLYGQRQR